MYSTRSFLATISMNHFAILFILAAIGGQKIPPYRVEYMDDKGDGSTFTKKVVNLRKEGPLTALVVRGQRYYSLKRSVKAIYIVELSQVGRVMIRIVKINFYGKKDGNCSLNRLAIFPSYISRYRRPKDNALVYCTKEHAQRNEVLVFKHPMIVFLVAEFSVSSRNTHSIELSIVAFNEGPCIHKEFNFPCMTGICISKSLVCDGYDHCGEKEDEPYEQCEYRPMFCNSTGKVKYSLLNDSTDVIIFGGDFLATNTHESCYAEISSEIPNSEIIVSVRRLYSVNWYTECSTMLQIYTDDSGKYTFCNINKSMAHTSILKANSSVKIFSFVTLGGNSEYEVLVLATGRSSCGGNFNFTCQDGRCISELLLCDSYSHCEDGSDESFTYAGCTPFEGHVISRAAGVGLGLLLGIMTLVIILVTGISCIWSRKRKRSSKKIPSCEEKQDGVSKVITGLSAEPAVIPLPEVQVTD